MLIKEDDDWKAKYNDWKIGVKGNFVAIGWADVDPTDPSLNDKELLIEKLNETDGDGSFNRDACTILRFVNDISRGDIVVLPRYKENSSELEGYNIGRIKSDKAYYVKSPPSDEEDYCTRWGVQWLRKITKEKVSKRLRRSIDAPGTVHKIDNDREYDSEIEALLKDYT